jgi:tetratricopeptide (TPR) repeat protein
MLVGRLEAEPADLRQAALDAAESGALDAAVSLGSQSLADAQARGVDDPDLVNRLARWLEEQDRLAEARDMNQLLVDIALRYRDEEARARREVARIKAQLAGEDPVELALNRAAKLRDRDDFDGVIAEVVSLRPEGLAPAQAERAAVLLDWAQGARGQRIQDVVAASRAVLETAGPYEPVDLMLAELERLGPGADRDRVLEELRGELDRKRLDAGSSALAAAEDLPADVERARELIGAERYDEALELLDQIDSPTFDREVQALRQEASDAAVRILRDKASRAYARARNAREADQKRSDLEQARELLASAVAKYPHSTFGSRLRENITAVERELAKLPAPEADPEPEELDEP